jgi:hypothetical protein
MDKSLSILLTRFAHRDALYILSGTIVILSLAYSLGFYQELRKTIATYEIIIAFAASYVVGYAIQEAMCLLPFFGSSLGRPLNAVDIALCGLFAGLSPLDRDILLQPIHDEASNQMLYIDENASQANKYQLDRIINLKHIGLTMCPGTSLAGCLWFFSGERSLGLIILVFALIFFMVSRIKLCQQKIFIVKLHRHLVTRKQSTPPLAV